MDVAFAGGGDVADAYASELPAAEELSMVAVADPDLGRAASLADEAGAEAYADVATMLGSSNPSVVVNLTSHAAHATVTRTCLEAGVHVWSEKPLALDAAEASALVSLARSADLALGCAPIAHRAEHQRLAATRLADGTLGEVRVATATAHVGRVTDWHDRPESFLDAGPLLDGGVYPLSLLVEWFGPVTRVRTADATSPYPDRANADPERPTHVEAILEFHGGPSLRLTASFYVPHTAREFYGLELHGDDASLHLEDAGDLGGHRNHYVSVGRAERAYTAVPLQHPPRRTPLLSGPAGLAAAIERGERPRRSARRGAHVVAICEAIERAAEVGDPVAVDDVGVEPGAPPAVGYTLESEGGDGVSVRLPPIGFGCSRYRDGEHVDRVGSIEAALDAGYRLLDSAELYGNERRIGEILAAPGSPDRHVLVVISKVWNTNHGHVREACETTLEALGLDALDGYLLHWPDSWEYTGPLVDLASLPSDEREARTFPRDENGNPRRGGVPLEEAWRGLEAVHDAGLTRAIGICNVGRETLTEVLDVAEVPPAVVQVERHPYRPQRELVEFCHGRGIRVMAHSPLSAPGLLDEPVLEDIADGHDATPAQVVLAWNVEEGVVPIPSSVDRDHVVENAAAAGLRLGASDRERIAELADPGFER